MLATAYVEGVETEIIMGMGATEFLPDRLVPYTVFSIIGPAKIIVRQDHAVRNPDGSYTISRNPAGVKVVVTKRDDRRWRRQGELMTGPTFGINQRQAGER